MDQYERALEMFERVDEEQERFVEELGGRDVLRRVFEERRRRQSQRAIERGEPDPWARLTTVRNQKPAAEAPSQSLADRVAALEAKVEDLLRRTGD